MADINRQTDNTLCELSHLGLLTLSGEDAVTFLQGQVTNDVKALDGSNTHYSGYCSPKGRLLALFLAFAHQDNIYLQFSHPILAPIMKRLKMYVMRSKVDIADVSDDMVRLGVNGPDVRKLVTEALGKVPEHDYALVHAENSLIIKLPSIAGQQRYEVLVDAANAEAIRAALAENFSPVEQTYWDWLDIQTGCPDVLKETQEQFVPQMLNLDILNGINFKKGCYTGQEIVARTHYLGKVKRRTYLASIAANEQPMAGDKVFNDAESEVGQIVRAAPNLTTGVGTLSFDALIEVRVEAKLVGDITWQSAPVTFRDLPYSVADD